MNRDDLERLLHDYLDDRLGPDERAAFEDAARSDPGLEQRIRAYRDLGRVLRARPAEPPPDFAARARARFEAERRGGHEETVRHGFGWEALGVAAAALVLAALLVPWMRLEAPVATPERPASAVLRDEQAQTAPAPVPAPAPTPTPAPAPAPVLEKKAEPAAPEAPAPRPAPVPEGAPAEERFAPAPSAAVGSERAAARSAPMGALAKARADLAEEAVSVRALPLPGGLLPDDAVNVVSDATGWAAVVATPGAAALAALDPRFPAERVVLVGPRGSVPLACGRAALEPAGPGRLALVLPVAASGGATAGCAVAIPAGAGAVDVRVVP